MNQRDREKNPNEFNSLLATGENARKNDRKVKGVIHTERDWSKIESNPLRTTEIFSLLGNEKNNQE